jgi:hypothetical protein
MTIKIENETVYTTEVAEVRGNTYRITHAQGKFNYIEVCKLTNNPFGGRIGKEFKTWDEAARHYKSAEMRTVLLLCELNFKRI